jgi:hypothetical protein
VDPEALKAAVAEALGGIRESISQEITGAVKRQIASTLEGVDLEALKKGKPGTPEPDKQDKVNPLEAKLGELTKEHDSLKADVEKYRQRALRAGVVEAVAEAKVHEDARPLLVTTLAALAKEDEAGKLYIPGENDTPVPLADHLTAYLKDKPGLLESAARPGSGAGESANTWTGDMPKTRADVMYERGPDGKFVIDPVTQQPKMTPDRVSKFIAAKGQEAWDKLPE